MPPLNSSSFSKPGIAKPLPGFGHTKYKRLRKLSRDNIMGITNPAIRRLARRGGVKRMSAEIYNDVRAVVKARLTEILRQITLMLHEAPPPGRKTITSRDVVFVLKRLGTPIYGFDERRMQRKLMI